jgi:hypothetical protein
VDGAGHPAVGFFLVVMSAFGILTMIMIGLLTFLERRAARRAA